MEARKVERWTGMLLTSHDTDVEMKYQNDMDIFIINEYLRMAILYSELFILTSMFHNGVISSQ